MTNLEYNPDTELRLTVDFNSGLSVFEKYKSITGAAAFTCGFNWYSLIINDLRIHKNKGQIVFTKTHQMEVDREKAVNHIEKAKAFGEYDYFDIHRHHQELRIDYDYELKKKAKAEFEKDICHQCGENPCECGALDYRNC